MMTAVIQKGLVPDLNASMTEDSESQNLELPPANSAMRQLLIKDSTPAPAPAPKTHRCTSPCRATRAQCCRGG